MKQAGLSAVVRWHGFGKGGNMDSFEQIIDDDIEKVIGKVTWKPWLLTNDEVYLISALLRDWDQKRKDEKSAKVLHD